MATGSADAATAVRLVAQRELSTRLRTKSFAIGTIVLVALIAGYVLLQQVIFGDADRVRIGLSGQATGLSAQIQQAGDAFGMQFETTAVAPDEARAQLSDGDLDAVVSGTAADLHVLVESDLDATLREILTGISRQEVLTAQLAREGVADPNGVLAEAARVEVQVERLAATGQEDGQRLAVGLVMVFLLFFGISSYGALVAQGVIEEKTSRVVELLLATIRPWQLLLGKVIGIGIVGLCQLVIVGGIGLAMALGSGVVTVGGVGVNTVLWGVLWYVLGFFLYATIYAGAGALVSRQEDAQAVLAPVTMVIVVGFVVGFNVMIVDAQGTTSTALSLTPLLAPILMPGRIAAGAVAGWEIAIAIALTLALTAVFTWLGGRMYAGAVLRTGSRMKLTDALRS